MSELTPGVGSARFMMKTLLIHPSVADVKSSFALQRIKDTTALPLM